MAHWQAAINQKIEHQVGIGRGFCTINNQEYHGGPDGPHAEHAGEIQWDYNKATYQVLNVYTDHDLTSLQAHEVEAAFELLDITNSDWD